ncbi:SocA family protein [Fictibacillus nanhaiensis]|uniref:SocA family protein n=1 Tax=Fictibacillus nanhaiensis TaxID=742169 RepID=A0ABS2ZLQ7_9BACL|nr:SocA family protein [Fictibacillus nanhaiensis]
MNKIRGLLRYFTLYYPHKNELSKTRITKMVYLADWFSAKEHKKQLTNIKWYFDHYGPYVSDVYDEAESDRKIVINHTYSVYGTPKGIIGLKKEYNAEQLHLNTISDSEKEILDQVIEKTKNLHWSEFIDYVYSTYPIRTQKKYGHLDLISLADEEREIEIFIKN